jgi:hypothetical protein
MYKKSRANFQYRLGVLEGRKTLLIWDQNIGNISVTNDIENVVADIAKHEDINPAEYLIIYRDSEGRWDGWDAATQEFFVIGRFLTDKLDPEFQSFK